MNHYYLVDYWYLSDAENGDYYRLRFETKEDAIRMKETLLASSVVDPCSVSVDECFENGMSLKLTALDD